MDETEKTDNATDADETVQVGCRFRKSELAAMKRDTGATGDATTVAGFVRKRLGTDGSEGKEG